MMRARCGAVRCKKKVGLSVLVPPSLSPPSTNHSSRASRQSPGRKTATSPSFSFFAGDGDGGNGEEFERIPLRKVTKNMPG